MSNLEMKGRPLNNEIVQDVIGSPYGVDIRNQEGDYIPGEEKSPS